MHFHRNKSRYLFLAAAALALMLMGAVLLNVPSVQARVGWRVEVAKTYLRGIIHPVQSVPTALPLAQVRVFTLTPTAQSTVQPTATATATPAISPTPTFTPTPLPGRVVLTPAEHEVQDINNCGPATLSMYLRYWGWEGDQKTIDAVVKPIRQDRNVNVDELVVYAREHAGWLSSEFRVGGNINLLKQLIAAGMPVMIEEGFIMEEFYWPNDDRWAGHYLLLTGYDDSLQVFYGQDSFVGPNRVSTYTDLDKTWQSFNRVYVVLFPPEKEAEVKAILGDNWDPDQNRRNALEVARQETEDDPTNGLAWFNLGSNQVYFDQYAEAAQSYDQARNLGIPQRMLRYQFGPFFAYFQAGRTDDLLALTEYALERTPNSEEALLWHGWAQYRLGNREQAIADFQKALEAHADYTDAQYALEYVINN